MANVGKLRLGFVSLLVVAGLLLAACQPIMPEAESGAAPGAAQAEAAPVAAPLAGDWTGSIAVAGIELGIEVTFTPEGDGYTATMNIPQQGAAGLPVHSIEVALPAVRFAILEGPQRATFDGALEEDGVIRGAFAQAGQEGAFTLGRAAAGDAGASAGSGIAETYTDPNGYFSVPVPTNWTLEELPGYVRLTNPEGGIKVSLLVVPTDDPIAAIATGWEIVQPGFDLEPRDTFEPPSSEGIERTVLIDYKAGDGTFVQAYAQVLNGVSHVGLYEGTIEALQRRGSQVQIISTGYKILAQEKVDLSAMTPGEMTDEIVATWEAFIERAMAALDIPGAAVGVVRDGELVYARGFGYADPATQTPMTPQTHMMIGSTTKSFSTLLMATLVDDGLMSWDTPAQALYPSFAVKDPELSKTLTMRNLVCACTGVPRRDFEFLFNFSELDAADVVASLADFEFFTDFGEAFQYSNQMVAAGGFIAGRVAKPGAATLEEAYAAALQERVLDPIGMAHTTLSFDEVLAAGDYATPHGYAVDGSYEPISLDIERSLVPIAPSGGLWSTLEDMAKYMEVQLSGGVAPDGTRVVSEENLLITRVPQVKINAQAAYGLGWMVGDYKGLPIVEHGGNTLGYTSDFGFFPTANLGVIVLANAQGANALGGNARIRLIELLYGLESEVEPAFDFVTAQMEKSRADLAEQLGGDLDVAAVEPFAGVYANPVLGTLMLSIEGGRLYADVGEFKSELRPKVDEDGQPDGYMSADPPLAGLAFRLEESEGARRIVMGEGLTEYAFTPAP